MIKALKAKLPEIETETVVIKTLGDKVQNKPLSALGGGGVFAASIENALVSGKIDIAVHSAKDLPKRLESGLEIRCVLKRGDPRDVLITRAGSELGRAAVIGTGSIRRRKSFAKLYPNAVFSDIRGNVDTRIKKLKNGGYDGIILAAAGLERLGCFDDNELDFHRYELERFLCAPCQGIIAVESRKNDLKEILSLISDKETFYAFEAERQVLKLLGGDCSIPLGACAKISGGRIKLIVTRDCEKIVSGEADTADRLALAEGLVARL